MNASSLRSSAASAFATLASQSALDLATRLALMLLLLSDWVVGDLWAFKLPLRVAAIVGLLMPAMHRNRNLWLVVMLCMLGRTFSEWWVQDNHVFLLTWWTGALWASLGLQDGERALARASRLLIGLAFAFATVWKVFLSPDFMSGAYFHYTFLTDPRFRQAGLLLGGMEAEAYRFNASLLAQLVDPTAAVQHVTLRSTEQLALLTRGVTLWTAAIEAALALCFLWPEGQLPSRLRHALLLVFSWTTYLVANVETFGWTLLVIGLAQCEPERRVTRALYALSCPLVLLYDYVPLLAILRRLME